MGYQINLEQFEGPFDLLLHLIHKNQIDIYDISISEITGEYLETLRQWKKMDLEIASEFILMAARLMEIKSRMLISGNNEEDIDIEAEKEKLVAQLVEYQTYKKIADYFQKREEETRGAVFKEHEYYPQLENNEEIEIDSRFLEAILKKMIAMYRDDHSYKSYSGEIKRDLFTVEEKVELLSKKFEKNDQNPVLFSELICNGIRQEVIVAFQAILTCYKAEKIRVSQMELFGEIWIHYAG